MSQNILSTVPTRLRTWSLARWAGWFAIALGILAFYVALPPLLVRSTFPSLAITGIGVLAGIWALRHGEQRLGIIGILVAIAGSVGAVAATRAGIGNLEQVVVWSALVAAMLRFATPLIFAALGGVISERSGVVNVGLEGMMLIGAFFGLWGADITNGWVGGVLIGVAAGALTGLLFAVFVVSLKANQIVAGMAINLLALGLTGYLLIDIYGTLGTGSGLPQVPDLLLPISGVPFFGRAFGERNLLIRVALALVAATSIYLFRTSSGLRLRSVGENPLAADTAGISVTLRRYFAVITSGVLASLGGVFLSLGFVHSFTQSMTAGRGFIALAAVIFGRWRPGGALIAALLFGFSSALAQRLPVFSPTAATLFQALPYVLTLIAVAGLVGRSRAPAAVGVAYERS